MTRYMEKVSWAGGGGLKAVRGRGSLEGNRQTPLQPSVRSTARPGVAPSAASKTICRLHTHLGCF